MISLELLAIIITILAFFTFVTAYFFSTQVRKLKDELSKDDSPVLMEWLKEMKSSVEKNSDTLEKQLQDHRTSFSTEMLEQRKAMDMRTKLMWERLDKTSEVIQGVQKHLGGIQEFGKDMKDLSNILKSPKLRGGFGEQMLYELLEDFMPKEMYKTQYKFRDGSSCDAVIFSSDVLIPIDSKFPMENFKLLLESETDAGRVAAKRAFVKDVKKRIDEISSKYILPEEGTTDQAVMYVPSENVYYELVVNTPEIETYARQKSVFLTSPNTFVSFLNVLLVAHRRQELQKHAGEILKALDGIRNEAEKFDSELATLEGHIERASKSSVNVRNKYQKLFSRIDLAQSLNAPDAPELESVENRLLDVD